MGELNLNQIEDKLNEEFDENERVIIFWYDGKKEFEEDIEKLELKDAKIHKLAGDNLFETKVLLERKDKHNNYLIYAPFEKPDNRENHLADIILYSKGFSADRATLICTNMEIDIVYKPIIEKHINFFNSKARKKKFQELEVDKYDKETIEIALLSAIVDSKVANFDKVLKIVLSDESLIDNKYMIEFGKYNLDKVFWKYCNRNFSYEDEEPSLTKFVMSLIITYANNQLRNKKLDDLKSYILSKSGTVMTFIDQMMNSRLYEGSFRKLSDLVYKEINGDSIFKDFEIEDLIEVDVFKDVDKYIIKWIKDRLLDENLNIHIDGKTMAELCKSRKFKHYKEIYEYEYNVLWNAYYLIFNKDLRFNQDLLNLVKLYDEEYYKIDTHYRKFYYYLDKLDNMSEYEDLRNLIENIYINRYLDVLSSRYIEKFDYEEFGKEYILQKDFYRNYIAPAKHRMIVIVSDAFRYEVAKELFERFEYNERLEAKISPMIGMFPSYTSLGMAALLPNKKLEFTEDYQVLNDGRKTISLGNRKSILKAENEKSNAIQYKELMKKDRDEIRDVFIGQDVIYIYHDTIDAIGDKMDTEDDVFQACEQAMEEIDDLIRMLVGTVSAVNFIITADHGFIYTRSKNKESDKIESFFEDDDKINKRFIISDNDYDIHGTKNIVISDLVGSYDLEEDKRSVTTPLTSNVFKTRGGNQNFVHGGASPQEIIVPVIEVRSIRGSQEIKSAEVSLVNNISQINSLIIILDFVQKEPVSDVVKTAKYKFGFVNENDDYISNEEIYIAKSESKDSADRMFSLKFSLRNQKYERDDKYYFRIINSETGVEVYRERAIIDIAFADDFGFDI